MTPEHETYEEWRERTAPPRGARPSPLSIGQSLRLGLGLAVATAVLLAFGATVLSWITGLLALGALVQAAVPVLVPGQWQEHADTLMLLLGFGLGSAFTVVVHGNRASDWIGLGLGMTLVVGVKIWGLIGMRRAAR